MQHLWIGVALLLAQPSGSTEVGFVHQVAGAWYLVDKEEQLKDSEEEDRVRALHYVHSDKFLCPGPPQEDEHQEIVILFFNGDSRKFGVAEGCIEMSKYAHDSMPTSGLFATLKRVVVRLTSGPRISYADGLPRSPSQNVRESSPASVVLKDAVLRSASWDRIDLSPAIVECRENFTLVFHRANARCENIDNCWREGPTLVFKCKRPSGKRRKKGIGKPKVKKLSEPLEPGLYRLTVQGSRDQAWALLSSSSGVPTREFEIATSEFREVIAHWKDSLCDTISDRSFADQAQCEDEVNRYWRAYLHEMAISN